MTRRFAWFWTLAAMVLVLGLVAGCGDDDEDQGSAAGIEAGTGSRADRAVAAGEREAERAGGEVELPAITVGLLQSFGQIEAGQRAQNQFERAAETVGWRVRVCDAQGDPTEMARCADSLLDQNVRALFSIGVEPSILTAQLRKAQRNDVPVVNYGGTVSPSPLFAGSYAPDDGRGGKLLADYVVDRLNEVEGSEEIAIHDFPAVWAMVRSAEMKKAAERAGDIDVAVTYTTDATNPVHATRQVVTDQLTKNPDLKAFWLDFGTGAPQGAADALRRRFQGEEFPEKPLLVTFLGDQVNLDLIRAGTMDAVADWPYDATAWVAVDQAAEFFARDKPFDDSPRPDYGGFEWIDYAIIDRDSLPPEGEYREPKEDFVTFFRTKWQQEFGVGDPAQE